MSVVNSLKSSEDLWGPVPWHSRLDPFPYSEPLTNLASYFGARGFSDVKARNEHVSKQTGLSPNPLSMSPVELPSCAHWKFNLIGVRMRAYATRLGSVHLPRDARRKYVRRSRHLLFTTRKSRAIKLPESKGTRPISRTSFWYSSLLDLPFVIYLPHELGCALLARFDIVKPMN
ncbi:hypothetical protein CRG98_027006 [Punica granatum]|uniref:Uncharacterized protein n=1 Tax=Punica granatum TaxID=22663 RepID=A0A2I0J8L8_PUNGR|nr:hypothetical protein CRG98_027006 [Punica granatum]